MNHDAVMILNTASSFWSSVLEKVEGKIIVRNSALYGYEYQTDDEILLSLSLVCSD